MTRRLVVLAVCALGSPAAAQVTAFVDARIIDGTGHVIERGALVMRDGRIVDIGEASAVRVPDGATRIDARGKTLMPGLVNAHGHLSAASGLDAGPEYYTRDNLIRQLRAYAAYGVTTVFSLGDDRAEAFVLRDEQGASPDRARVFVAGPVIGGDSSEAGRAAAGAAIAMKPDLLKIRVDDNLGTARKMPEAAWRGALEAARDANLPLAAHIFYLSDATALAEASASMIAHSVRDRPVDEAFLAAMRSKRVCYSPTLMREVSTFVYESTPPWARDPFFRRFYSEETSNAISDEGRQQRSRASPAFALGQKYKAGLEIARANLKRVSDAGIRVAFGTDTGPAGRFQGFFEHLELEMMVAAGLTPMQAIVAATSGAASCWGRAGVLGVLAKGASADIVLLRANPLESIANTRSIDAVYVGGRLFVSP